NVFSVFVKIQFVPTSFGIVFSRRKGTGQDKSVIFEKVFFFQQFFKIFLQHSDIDIVVPGDKSAVANTAQQGPEKEKVIEILFAHKPVDSLQQFVDFDLLPFDGRFGLDLPDIDRIVNQKHHVFIQAV